MTLRLQTEHHLEVLSLKGGFTGSSEPIHFKMPHCWKSHVILGLDVRKYVFGVCYHIRLIPSCSATETSWGAKIVHVASFAVVPSRERTTKAQVRLRGCAGWSALLFASN